MARVTRSKIIDISEDETASPVSSINQLPSFSLRSDQQLAEITHTNAMAHAQNPLAAELRGLKAAYRTAIGGGRKGPKRNKKQNKKADLEMAGSGDLLKEIESLDAQLNANPTPELSYSTLQSREDEHQRFELPVEETPLPERRITRRQATKAQAGQFTTTSYNMHHSPVVVTPRTGEIDFITSLFGGRGHGRRPGWAVTNEHTLAERALPKPAHIDSEDVEASRSRAPTRALRSKGLAKEDSVGKEDMVAKQQAISEAISESLVPREYTSAPPSPSKSTKTLEEVERDLYLNKPATTTDDEEDSFVEQIITRSPAKLVTRIEDSVEALDQLEEALEALDEATLAEVMASPEKTRKKPSRDVRTPVDPTILPEKRRMERKPLHEDIFRPLSTRSQSAKPGHSSLRVKSTATKAPIIKKATSMVFRSQTPSEMSTTPQPKPKFSASKRPLSMFAKSMEVAEKIQPESTSRSPSRRPISLLPPSHTVKSSKPVTKASFELPGEAISRRLKEQREARQARKDASEDNGTVVRTVSGPQVKSTKPLTVSNFELPGEAISRRKREALDARLKVEEAEERKRREFKANPLRKIVVPNTVPRDTAASRARHSQIGLENIIENGAMKRNSIISNVGAHRPSLAQAIAANMTAPRAPGPAPTLTRKPSTISASGLNMSGRAMQRSVSATEVQVQRQRAKEAYNRDAKLTEEIERERREREAAAKRAREEAAERGRQASREWADRQIARKMAEGDRGMGVGYGAGGQMGLREEKFCVGAVSLG